MWRQASIDLLGLVASRLAPSRRALMRQQPRPRSAYKVFQRLATRWEDIDMYGHVNNVRYYSYFDTAVNRMMIEGDVLDPLRDDQIGVVVETKCTYFESLEFPSEIDVGISVASVGKSSVRFDVAVFRTDHQHAAAEGYFVHVYVDRNSRRPVALDRSKRALLNAIRLGAE